MQSDLGLNIREAHAFNTNDGFSLDVFVVDQLEEQVGRTLVRYRAGSPGTILHAHAAEQSFAHRGPTELLLSPQSNSNLEELLGQRLSQMPPPPAPSATSSLRLPQGESPAAEAMALLQVWMGVLYGVLVMSAPELPSWYSFQRLSLHSLQRLSRLS